MSVADAQAIVAGASATTASTAPTSATALADQLTGARQAFLDQEAGATDTAVKADAAYQAAMCLYYLKRIDKSDQSFDKEAGDVIAQFPSNPHNDDLAFHQALICVDRDAWGFVPDQMKQFVAAFGVQPRGRRGVLYGGGGQSVPRL